MKKNCFAVLASGLISSVVNATDTMLDDVVVSVSRSEQKSFDAPGSIQVVSRSQIESGGPQINLSEALVGIPGINVANRNNYAQDLQVSIRGYGARASFGVRGVKLLVDGVPATIADGQGQTSQFALTSADRIEVLKGPIASIYGNAAGGVINVFTKSPTDKPELTMSDTFGRYGLNHSNIQYSDRKDAIGFVVDASKFESTGFRNNSAANREHLNAKIELETERGKATFIANYLNNIRTNDSGSLTRANFLLNPYQSYPASSDYNKSFTQGIYGVNFQGKVDADRFYGYMLYVGDRKLNSTSTLYSVIDRAMFGGSASYGVNSKALGVPVKIISGVDYDYVKDYRLGYALTNLAVPNRNEDNLATSYGGFIQSEWYLSDSYTGLLGARFSSVTLKVVDRYLSDTDGSGSKTYQNVSPVLGITYHISKNANLYVQTGTGFESPTLNEVLYTEKAIYSSTSSDNKFYGNLKAAKSLQGEAGFKWRESDTKFDLAFFYAKTFNDLVPYKVRVTGSTWTNADTEKYGVEISGMKVFPKNIAIRASYTAMMAHYTESSGLQVSDGKMVPGIPSAQLYLDLGWRSVDWLIKPKVSYSEVGFDYRVVGKMYANSSNSESADGYQLLGLRASHTYKNGSHSFTLFGRVDNLLDKTYVSSLVVEQSSGRFYEPGMPRNWIIGAKYVWAM